MAKKNALQLNDPEEAVRKSKSDIHVYGKKVVCETDTRGRATPPTAAGSPEELVVDTQHGFVPLWKRGTVLQWRFQEHSLSVFRDPEAARTAITQLFGSAVVAWGDASPVRFSKAKGGDPWDFEIAMQARDNCNDFGCVLASAFFPDAGRHELKLYPQLFSQSGKEQVETLIHEIGHIFGLRHFFANVKEKAWPSTIFGKHDAFSIMNYGPKSILTDTDKKDLTNLYQSAWSGKLADINGTPIKLFDPFHTSGAPAWL